MYKFDRKALELVVESNSTGKPIAQLMTPEMGVEFTISDLGAQARNE